MVAGDGNGETAAMTTLLFTGFPGFLGSALLPRVLARDPDARAVCVVQDRFEALAKTRVDELVAADPSLAGRIDLVEGDITEPDIGILNVAELRSKVTHIWHLAAVYDLSVARDVAMRINVTGTRNVLDFARGCPALERLEYVSTCYVSGRYAGTFKEDDLIKGQSFNNFYEETKYLAEVDVREAMNEGMPANIYRPSIVVGDSRTGATQKFDGPYFVIRWLLKQPGRWAVLPILGDPSAVRLNVVPRDYVIDAIEYLSGETGNTGTTFSLGDPAPLTIADMLVELERSSGKKLVRVRLPRKSAKWSIDKVPGVFRLLEIPAAATDYFVHPTFYDCTHTLGALAGSGITCPPFASYVDHLVDFVRAHPEIASDAMI